MTNFDCNILDKYKKKNIIMYICQYCGKVCKNLNSLRQHEVRCNSNPNKIDSGNKGKTKGYITISKNDIEKHVSPSVLESYLNDGWVCGASNYTKLKCKEASNKFVHSGISKTPEQEQLRKSKISKTMMGNKNWMYNKRHGNGKKGHYHGIYCDSTWELAFLVYCFDNNVSVKRCNLQYKYMFEGEEHIYIPDFITPEGIIEVKGRIDAKAREKIQQFPEVILYDKEKMKPIIKYVSEKYGIEFWKVLYDKYN